MVEQGTLVRSKGSSFLNSFWDLVSDCDATRERAAAYITNYLTNANKERNDQEAKKDIGYTLQRLVKGLSSSRESARLGFASCLVQVLSQSPEVKLQDVMVLIEESTKLTGSAKRADERDLLFGRLFGCLALTRSGRLLNDHEMTVKVFHHLVDLLGTKGWMKEVLMECILEFLQYCTEDILLETVVPKLHELLIPFPMSDQKGDIDSADMESTLVDMTSSQLMLTLGLEFFSKQERQSSAIRKAIKAILPRKRTISAKHFHEIQPTLIAACAGFPKMHRVWDYLVASVFGMNIRRELPQKRVISLEATQEETLTAICTFIDSTLLTASHEKKGVAMALVCTLAPLTPPELLPLVVSKSFVRTVLAARVNKKNILHTMALEAINRIVEGAGVESTSRIALASALVQYGGADFDASSGTRAISTLLEGVDAVAMKSHAKFLCGILGSLKRLDNDNMKQNDGEVDDAIDEAEERDQEIEEEAMLQSATSTIDALIALSRNNRLSSRGNICTCTVALLLRISLFSEDASVTPSVSASGKRKKTKSSTKTFDWPEMYREEMVESIKMVEVAFPLNPKIVEMATQRLLILLADFGSQSIEDLNSDGDKNQANNESKVTILDMALYCLNYMLDNAKLELDRDLGSEDELAPYPLQEDLTTVLNMRSLIASSSITTSTKLLSALYHLVGNAIFQVLSSAEGSDAEIPISTIPQLVKVCHMLLAQTYPDHFEKVATPKDTSTNDDDNDSEDEGATPSALSLLFDASMELLSVPSHHSVKGVRDAIKRTWNVIATLASSSHKNDHNHDGSDGDICTMEIDLDLIDEVLTAVIGDDGDDGDSIDEEGMKEEEEDEDDDDDDGNVECKLEGGIDEEYEEQEDDEKDIKLNSAGLMDVLEADMNDEEEDAMLLEHSKNADAALIQMIEMRRQGRKHGLMKAKQRELLIRTRAIDVLEILVSKIDDVEVLVAIVRPLLGCYVKIQSSSLMELLQEGRTFDQRLRTLLEMKLLKKKFPLAMVSDDVRSNVLDEFTTCVELSFSLLSNAKPNLRQLSAVVILCIMKSAVSPLCPEFYSPLKDLLSDMLQKVFDECMEKRNNRITLKFFEDCLVRCPEFTIRTLLSRLVRGTVGGKTPYLRSECCRLISMIVKKKESQFEEKNLSDFIIKECFHLAKNIGDALSSSSTETGTSRKDSDNRTKRIKPILLCIKDLSILLKSQKTSKTANKRDSTQKATKELVDAVHVAVSLNSNLKQLADQIFANLGQNPSADERKDGNSDMDVNKSGDNRESNKNDNGSNKRKNSLSEVESMRNWGLEDKSDENMKKKSKRSKKTHS